MKRRHLFDKGQPVTRFTLIAGSHVLLAVSRQTLRAARERLASSLLQLADCADSMSGTVARCIASRIELRSARSSYAKLFAHAESGHPGARNAPANHVEPPARPTRA